MHHAQGWRREVIRQWPLMSCAETPPGSLGAGDGRGPQVSASAPAAEREPLLHWLPHQPWRRPNLGWKAQPLGRKSRDHAPVNYCYDLVCRVWLLTVNRW